jgi:hypothetical protein
MGIKIGDLSPLGGAITGKGLFGKGLGAMNKALGPMAGIMPRMAGAAQKKTARRAATAAEVAAIQKAEFDAKRAAASGMRARPMIEEVMVAEQAPAMGGRFGVTDRGENTKQFKKGGKVKKMAKGGSASKRGDGIATQGKTKGRFI